MTEETQVDTSTTQTQEKIDGTNTTTQDTTETTQDTAQKTDATTTVESDKKEASTTVLSTEAKKDDAADTTTGDFPTDWREKLAGTDEKLLKRLARFASPKALADSFVETEKKLSTTRPATVLPKDATDEQIAEYRRNNGIPDAPTGYDTTLEGGLIIGENDKPLVDKYLEIAHAQNMKPSEVKSNLQSYFAIKDAEEAQRNEAIEQYRAEANTTLRSEWGKEYHANINAVKSLLTSQFGESAGLLENATLPDGSILGDNPAILRSLANLAREINPVATLVPGSAGSSMDSIKTELEKISATRRENPKAYWKDESIQTRELELLAAQEKLQARAG